MEAVFYFNFVEDDEDEDEDIDDKVYPTRAFHISGLPDEPWSSIEDVMSGYAEDLEEEYGVHDWCSSPVEGVNAFGYMSYEVNGIQNQNELMESWRQAFLKQYPQATVGPCYTLETTGDDNDHNIMVKVKRKMGF